MCSTNTVGSHPRLFVCQPDGLERKSKQENALTFPPARLD